MAVPVGTNSVNSLSSRRALYSPFRKPRRSPYRVNRRR